MSVLLFVPGVATPLVTMTVTGTVPGVGAALIQATTNGMLAAIGDLRTTHSVLALLVRVFSVVLPIVKLRLASWVLPGTQLPLRVVRGLHLVGAWSMADVLVVAVVIALLSPLAEGRIVHTHIQAGIGLDFLPPPACCHS